MNNFLKKAPFVKMHMPDAPRARGSREDQLMMRNEKVKAIQVNITVVAIFFATLQDLVTCQHSEYLLYQITGHYL